MMWLWKTKVKERIQTLYKLRNDTQASAPGCGLLKLKTA